MYCNRLPLCGMNLDMRREQWKKFNKKFDLPVYYVAELVALAAEILSRWYRPAL